MVSFYGHTVHLQLVESSILYAAVVNGCTSGFLELDLLRRRAEKIPAGGEACGVTGNGLDNEFRLILAESFSCNETMTGLLLVGTVRTDGGRDKYPEIQIWRITGANNYTRKSSEVIKLTKRDFSPDGVYQYNLSTSLPFQSGDVLGVYQPDEKMSVVRVYYDSNATTLSHQVTASSNPTSLINISNSSSKQPILLSPVSGK